MTRHHVFRTIFAMAKKPPSVQRTRVDPLKRVEHAVKRLAFLLLQVFLRRGKKLSLPLDGYRMRRVLLLRPETKLGDMVISLPTVDCLRRTFPHLKVSIFCSTRNAALIEKDPRFDQIYLYRKRFWTDLKELGRVRRRQYDCVIDLLCDDSITTLFLSQFASPGRPRIGTGKARFRSYYDVFDGIAFDPSDHVIINTLGLLRVFGIDPDEASAHTEPYLEPNSRQRAEDFVRSLGGVAPDRPLVGLNLSSGHPSRDWGDTKSSQLAQDLTESHPDVLVLVFTIPKESWRGKRLSQRLSERVIAVPDDLSILDAAALIRHLSLLITPDTALVHIARAFRVPVVSMHTSHERNLAQWRPYGQSHGAVVSDSLYDIHSIQVESVLTCVEQVLASLSDSSDDNGTSD